MPTSRKHLPLPKDARPATDDEILRFLIWDGYIDIVTPRRADGAWVAADRSTRRLTTLGKSRDYYVIHDILVSRLNGANVSLHRIS